MGGGIKEESRKGQEEKAGRLRPLRQKDLCGIVWQKDVFVDLGAEQILAAEKGDEKIAVEVKSFQGASDGRSFGNSSKPMPSISQPVGMYRFEVIFDESNDHYELIYAGWNGPYRIHGSVLHLDIRQGKVWIQHDGTADGIAEELVRAGIPRDRIGLAFKPPEIRPHTDFAVA